MGNGNDSSYNAWAFVQKWVGAVVVTLVLGVAGGFINMRDTVRDHTLYLDSLRDDQSEGRRFTREDGDNLIDDVKDLDEDIKIILQDIKKIRIEITKLSIIINSGKSREHDEIKGLKNRLFALETKYWEQVRESHNKRE